MKILNDLLTDFEILEKKSEERILIRANRGQGEANKGLLHESFLPQIVAVCLDCKDVKWG